MNDIQITISQEAEIKTNFNSFRKDLAEMVKPYENMVITEDDIPNTKHDLADLNKARKQIEDKRKEIKREYLVPYERFEQEVKECLKIIDAPIDDIKGKLEKFEEKRIADKQVHLKELYEEHIGEYAEFLPYEKIARKEWNNKTYEDNQIIADISEQTTTVRSHLDAIRALGSEIEETLIETYKAAGNDLTTAINKNADYISAKQLAEQKVKEEAEKKAKEEAEKQEVYTPKEAEEVFGGIEAVPIEEDLPFPVSWEIRIEGQSNIDKVKKFLSVSGIDYKEI